MAEIDNFRGRSDILPTKPIVSDFKDWGCFNI